MTSRTSGTARDPHDEHDLEAVAAFAAGDATGASSIAAERLVRDCARCAALVDDLRLLAAATRSLPRTAIAPRDFRIDTAQAARLRGGRWRQLLRPVGPAGWNPRPFAAAFTTLGIAGLLIAIVPFASLLGGSGGASQRTTAAQAGGTAPAETAVGGPKVVVDASAGAGGGATATSAAPGRTFAAPVDATTPTRAPGGLPAPPNGAAETGGPAASIAPEYGPSSAAPTKVPSAAPNPPPAAPPAPDLPLPLILLSVALIGIGAALFVVGRRSSRRR